MSGGALTNCEHNLFVLGDWADRVEAENPLLAEHMRDLYDLLYKYDYYMSGDIGKDEVFKAWEAFHTKWFCVPKDAMADHILSKVKAEADAYIDSIRLGYDPRPKWWEVRD